MRKTKFKVGDIVYGWKIIEIVSKDKHRNILYKVVSTMTGKMLLNISISHLKKSPHGKRYPKTWTNSRLKRIFYNMKTRCGNPHNREYKNYGQRGVQVCQEWLGNPKAFEEWALEHGYKDDLTIDRINVDGNYEPSNCRWISLAENVKWTKRSHAVWIGPYVDTMSGWSKRINRGKAWFSYTKTTHNYDYAYKRLLEEIEKLGGIKKVMGVEEEPDISQVLEDIENDCLEVEL